MRATFATILVGLLFFAAQPSVATETVRTRAGKHDGFGRIVFDWPKKAAFKTGISGETLTVIFDRPLRTDLASVRRHLSDYIGATIIEPDGRTLAFALKRPARLRSFRAGNAIVLDLHIVREAAAGPGDTVPQVMVRAARHPKYRRMVLDWPTAVDYQLAEKDGTATLRFAGPGHIERSRLKALIPPFATAAVTSDENTLTFSLAIPPALRLRHFRIGTRVVLDLQPRGSAASESAPPQPTASPGKPPADKLKTGEDVGKERKDLTKAAPARHSNAERKVAPNPAAGEKQPGVQPTNGPTRLIPEKSSTTRQPAFAARHPETKEPPSAIDVPRTGKDGVAHAVTPGTLIAIAPAAGQTQSPSIPDVTPVGVTRRGDAVTLQFDWHDQVRAAIFRRAGFIWIVFDRPSKLDISAIEARAQDLIAGQTQIIHQRATVLRIAWDRQTDPGIRRAGTAWFVDLPRQQRASRYVETAKVMPKSPDGRATPIRLKGAGDPIELRDPEVGDRLLVTATTTVGAGILAQRDYPEFRLLATLQGVVVNPLIEGLRVRAARHGLTVTSSRSLTRAPDIGGIEPAAGPSPIPLASMIADIEQTTRDFVLDTLTRKLQSAEVAELVAHALTTIGYRAQLLPKALDGWSDIIASRDELGVTRPRMMVRVNNNQGQVTAAFVAEFHNRLKTEEAGLLITLGSFAAQARAVSRDRPNFRLIDGNELVEVLLSEYERFDARHKAMVPLRRVYAPDRDKTMKKNL